ncbi:hypothetical protein ENBRE01_1682 [Enteropsectra breve]|nr:hypothetical protein ENBRE01_1682 [Enteropsectra breve]
MELWTASFKIKDISCSLRCSRKTVQRVIRFLNDKTEEVFNKMASQIGRENTIVEIDESKLGKRKYNKGHRGEGVWVFVMVERTPERRILLFTVKDRTAQTLTEKMIKYVSEDATIYSDCWKGYNKLCEYFYKHMTVNHTLFYKDPITAVHTNTIEGCWSGVKLNIPYKNRHKGRINLYLLRFMLLRNEKKTHPLVSLIKYLL